MKRLILSCAAAASLMCAYGVAGCRSRNAGSVAMAADGDSLVSNMRGKGGEDIQISYTATASGRGGSVRIDSIKFVRPGDFANTGAPVNAFFIFSSTDESAVQRAVAVACGVQSGKTVCENTAPDTEFAISSSSTGLPRHGIKFTAVFDGMPVQDSFDSKAYFVWKDSASN